MVNKNARNMPGKTLYLYCSNTEVSKTLPLVLSLSSERMHSWAFTTASKPYQKTEHGENILNSSYKAWHFIWDFSGQQHWCLPKEYVYVVLWAKIEAQSAGHNVSRETDRKSRTSIIIYSHMQSIYVTLNSIPSYYYANYNYFASLVHL